MRRAENMDRRDFVKLTPLGSAAVAASLTLKVGDDEPTAFDVAVLRLKPGDVLVLTAPGLMSMDTAAHVKELIEAELESLDVKALVMEGGLTVAGVLRKG